jgi:2-oxoglutarate ferredoxin oxidoreductase subunit delta
VRGGGKEVAKAEVIPERCSSCAFCIDVCPKKVLDFGEAVNSKGYKYVVSVNEDDCIGCMMCAQICPMAAIDIYR